MLEFKRIYGTGEKSPIKDLLEEAKINAAQVLDISKKNALSIEALEVHLSDIDSGIHKINEQLKSIGEKSVGLSKKVLDRKEELENCYKETLKDYETLKTYFQKAIERLQKQENALESAKTQALETLESFSKIDASEEPSVKDQIAKLYEEMQTSMDLLLEEHRGIMDDVDETYDFLVHMQTNFIKTGDANLAFHKMLTTELKRLKKKPIRKRWTSSKMKCRFARMRPL